jgi:hypothetical protein
MAAFAIMQQMPLNYDELKASYFRMFIARTITLGYDNSRYNPIVRVFMCYLNLLHCPS